MMSDITVKLYGIAPDGAGLISGADAQAIISVLSSEIKELTGERDALLERIAIAERLESIFKKAPDLLFEDCLNLFPEEIAQIRAKAGRAGFVAGIDALETAQILGSDFDAEKSANEYAAKVRKGGE